MTKIWNLPIVQMIPLSDYKDPRDVSIIYSGKAWSVIRDQLHLAVVQEIEVTEATVQNWDKIVPNIKSELVVSVGGGLPADAGKYFSQKTGLGMVCIPTALSVDAFFTWASGIRRDGCVAYIETKVPDLLLLDLDVIAAAPEYIRAAGITDVMSIATGSWDWLFAHEQDKNPPGMEYIPWVYDTAQSILNGVLDCAEAAGRGEQDGLKTLVDCLATEVQLCNQVGHARPEEGTEHYFAYCVENVMGHGLPHGDLVGPGILNAATWQGQPTARLEMALQACHVPLDRIPAKVVAETRKELPAYCEKHNLPFGIAHTLKF